MPIVMTKEEWERIKLWADETREDPDAVRRRDYLKYLTDSSRKMTKSWPNSLENVNKRNEEIRQARRDAAEQTNTRFYRRYCKRKIEEQERLMYSARDTIFKHKDAPKMMLSAVIETAIQHERALQLKFKTEVLDPYAKEQKRLNDQDITDKAKAWTELQKKKTARKREINKVHQQELLDQIKEHEEIARGEKEEELRLQRMDIAKANEELEQLREFDENFKEAEKRRIWRDNEQSLREYKERQAEHVAREKMDDDLLHVLLKSKASIERKRKETEKGIRDERLRVLQAISAKLESGTAARDAKEQASLEVAIKQRNDADEARHQASLDKLARNKKENLDSRAKFLEDEAQRLHVLDTMKRWEMMNRFKNKEIYDEYKENQRKEKERKTKEYHDILMEMRKERDDRDKQERDERRYFYGELAEKKLREADNRLLSHAAVLLDEAKEKGRPQLPLLKAIDRYCKLYRLYPMPDLPDALQKIFPKYHTTDSSKPDPGYTVPPPPVCTLNPDAHDDEEEAVVDTANADGLQEIPRAGPSKPPPNKPATNEDYKRSSRVNGLQQKPQVPGVQVIPCTTADCTCDLKPKP